MTAADGLGQAGHCPSSWACAGIFIGGLAALTERARPGWPNTERIWENTQRSGWKKLCFCEHVSRSERDKRKHSFQRGGCWAGGRAALFRPLNRRSLVMVPEGELCAYADVFFTLHQSWGASRADLSSFSQTQLSHVHLQLSAQVCRDSRIWAREQELHHPSPWRQDLQVTVIVCAWKKTATETLTQLFQVMWETAEMEVEDSGLIHFSTWNPPHQGAWRQWEKIEITAGSEQVERL